MTPPLNRARPGKGPSVATLVSSNVSTVRSGAPILDLAAHNGGLVHGLLSVDELGRIQPIPPGGLTRSDLAKVQFMTRLHAVMPSSSFWKIGAAARVFHFHSDLNGLGELQREVLEQTVKAVVAVQSAADHPAGARPRSEVARMEPVAATNTGFAANSSQEGDTTGRGNGV